MQELSHANGSYALWVLLHHTGEAIFKARDRELRPFGVSTVEAGAVFIIQGVQRPATRTEIAREMFRRPNSVTGLLKRMQKKGLVRKISETHRKNVWVMLTAKGQQAHQKSMERKAIHRIFSSLSQRQRSELETCLKTLFAAAMDELRL